ncbi:hypothetical protein LQW54_008766 [Pestalotiopsis sp. IQ-011]
MKTFMQLLSFGLLATVASAVPVVEERQSAVYTLSVSTDGLYSLVDVVNIGQSGEDVLYDGFILRNNRVNHEVPGNWVAFPVGSGWQIKRYDGNAIVTQDYVPVTLVYKRLNNY